MRINLFVKACLACALMTSAVLVTFSIARPDGTGRHFVPELIRNEGVKASEPYGETLLKISEIPPSGGANSTTKWVANTGTVSVTVFVRVAALFNTGGRSSYKVSLRRGPPPAFGESGTEVASKTVIVSSANSIAGRVDLSAPVSTCDKTGAYHVRVSNVSTENPQRGIASYGILDGEILSTASDPEYKILSMSGFSLIDLDRAGEKTVSIGSFAKPGELKLKGKWHVPALLPTFKPLKIYLLRPNGTTAKSGTFYSIHSDIGTKLNTSYAVTPEDAAQTGTWKLKIVNASDSRIEGFNIKKGSDLNPFVPSFESSFTTACGS